MVQVGVDGGGDAFTRLISDFASAIALRMNASGLNRNTPHDDALSAEQPRIQVEVICTALVIDPVCGMEFDHRSAWGSVGV